MNEIKKAMDFRFACKVFDESKNIPQEQLREILNAGRLAPSSFGLEQWKFLVIQDNKTKQELQTACYNQEQISTCSDLIIILGRNDVKKGSAYFESCLDRFGDNKDNMRKILESFLSYMDEGKYAQWVAKQCYIASTHMMILGASLGIDSCPMEGFDANKIKTILELGDDVFVATLLPVGYRREEPKRAKMRWDLDSMVSFR